MISHFTDVACGWADDQKELERTSPVSRVGECRRRQCLMVAYAISTFELRSLDQKSAAALLELIVRYNYLTVFLDLKTRDSSLLEICVHVSSMKHSELIKLIKCDANQILTNAVKYVFAETPSTLKWSRVDDNSSCYEAMTLTEHFCIDILSVSELDRLGVLIFSIGCCSIQ